MPQGRAPYGELDGELKAMRLMKEALAEMERYHEIPHHYQETSLQAYLRLQEAIFWQWKDLHSKREPEDRSWCICLECRWQGSDSALTGGESCPECGKVNLIFSNQHA